MGWGRGLSAYRSITGGGGGGGGGAVSHTHYMYVHFLSLPQFPVDPTNSSAGIRIGYNGGGMPSTWLAMMLAWLT